MLARATVECGHDVTLLNQHALGVTPAGDLKSFGRIGAVEYKYILGSVERPFGIRSIGTKLRAVLALAKEIRARHAANAIDLLWFNHLSFYDVYPLTRLAQLLKVPTIQSYEDERFELVVPNRSTSSRLYYVNSWLADHYCPCMADAIIVISQYLERKYVRYVQDPRKVHVVPTIVDCDYWDVGPEQHSDTPTLLYAGTFAEQDEIDNLLSALALLRNQGRRFRLVALGAHRDQSSRAKLLAAITDRGLDDVVHLLGFVKLEEVRRQIAGANVLLNVRKDSVWSRSGLSTKLSEYLASGRTVVCTDLGDVPLYVKHCESALLVPATATSEQIAAAIDMALASPDLREKIGRAGREVAARCFGLRAVGDKVGAIIESAASIRPHRNNIINN
jgi:glycosyltransferase involved in cell wall biosynthesis